MTLAKSNRVAEVKRRILALRPDSQASWGRMNAAQMLCHLTDALLSAMGDRPVAPKDNWITRGLLRWVALHTPLEWPRGVRTLPEVDALIGGTPPAGFEADRQRLLAAIDRFVRSPRDFEFSPHAIFGPLTGPEWMIWAYRHSDHHLRQFGV